LTSGPGYRTDRLFLTSFDTQLANYSQDRSQRFYQNLLDRARAAPGVKSVALISSLPMDAAESAGIVPEGWQFPRGEHSISTLCASISDGYFQTMGIPMLEGRAVLETDRENTPLVAVVNEHMANHYWKGNALGKRFQVENAGQTELPRVATLRVMVAGHGRGQGQGQAPQGQQIGADFRVRSLKMLLFDHRQRRVRLE